MSSQYSEVPAKVGRLYNRQLRRLSHKSRSVSVSIVLVVAIALAVWAGIEFVLSMARLDPLVQSPGGALASLEAWVSEGNGFVIAAAVVGVILGIILLVLAFGSARRSRHVLASERLGIVIDDRVLASSAARSGQLAAGVDKGQVRATVSGRKVVLSVTPSSGFSVDKDAVKSAVEQELRSAGATKLGVQVSVEPNGKVGA